MVVNYESAKTTRPFPGIVRRILANSPEVMLTEHILQKGAKLPAHSHTHIQLIYLLSGQLVIEIGGQKLHLHKGDSYVVPSGAEHDAIALEDSVALDIFTPARQDYL
jgi:quercetin dioxygenase-like cupin family protein